MNELAFKYIVVMWVGSGVIGVVFLFRHGLAAALLRSFKERMGPSGLAVGWVVIAIIIPLMLAAGMPAYLYTLVGDDRIQCKNCGRRRGVLELYCANCEQPVTRATQTA